MFWKKKEPKEPVCICTSDGEMQINNPPNTPFKEAWMEKFSYNTWKYYDSEYAGKGCPIHGYETRYEWPVDNND